MGGFADVLGLGSDDSEPSFLRTLGGVVDTGVDVYERVRGGSAKSPSAAQVTPIVPTQPVAQASMPGWVLPVAAIAAYFLLFKKGR